MTLPVPKARDAEIERMRRAVASADVQHAKLLTEKAEATKELERRRGS